MTMDAAFAKSSSLGKLSNALLAVFTNCVENPQAFGPKSHVGRSSDGYLNSWLNSVPQSTGPTPNCPVLRGYSPVAWHTIDWYAVHRTVRRLQARIVKAVQAGRWGKVQA